MYGKLQIRYNLCFLNIHYKPHFSIQLLAHLLKCFTVPVELKEVLAKFSSDPDTESWYMFFFSFLYI